MFKRISSIIGKMQMPGIYFVFPGRDSKTKNKIKPKEIKIEVQPPLVVDTSALIDGRLADITETGFISGTFIVPDYVINELHKVADSKDTMKRNRGRRGLDVLSELKKSRFTKFKILKTFNQEKEPVDARLLELAKRIKGRVITTDYNLNKVGKVSGVPVLNVNELSNMVKTVMLPKEQFEISLINKGKERNQAVGYLPDGTMVVVEEGSSLIGKEIMVEVERVWQTDAGRMIFAKVV